MDFIKRVENNSSDSNFAPMENAMGQTEMTPVVPPKKLSQEEIKMICIAIGIMSVLVVSLVGGFFLVSSSHEDPITKELEETGALELAGSEETNSENVQGIQTGNEKFNSADSAAKKISPIITQVPTPTKIPTMNPTAAPPNTPVPTNTPRPTNAPQPAATASPAHTQTPTSAPTATATSTPSSTPTVAPTASN